MAPTAAYQAHPPREDSPTVLIEFTPGIDPGHGNDETLTAVWLPTVCPAQLSAPRWQRHHGCGKCRGKAGLVTVLYLHLHQMLIAFDVFSGNLTINGIRITNNIGMAN